MCLLHVAISKTAIIFYMIFLRKIYFWLLGGIIKYFSVLNKFCLLNLLFRVGIKQAVDLKPEAIELKFQQAPEWYHIWSFSSWGKAVKVEIVHSKSKCCAYIRNSVVTLRDEFLNDFCIDLHVFTQIIECIKPAFLSQRWIILCKAWSSYSGRTSIT